MTEAKNLRYVAGQWLWNALGKVRKERKRTTHSTLLLAESLLLSAQEYAETAFEAFAAGRWHPALSCSRTIFEMAIKVKWCCLKKDEERDNRLCSWAKETMTSQETIYRAFAETASEQRHRAAAHEEAERLRSEIEELRDVESLPTFRNIFEEASKSAPDPRNADFVYASLYKQLCKSVHAELHPDRYFEVVDGEKVRRAGVQKPLNAYWAVLTSVLWLVASTYEMLAWPTDHFGKEYADALRDNV